MATPRLLAFTHTALDLRRRLLDGRAAGDRVVGDGRARERGLELPRVMLVDDDRLMQSALARAFRDQIQLVAYATLAEAEAHASEPWQGLIVDRGLPDGDGLDFAKAVVARDADASVVLFTAAEPHEVYAEANRHGIVYAHKTDGIAVLRRMVAMWTKLARSAGVPTPRTRLERLAEEVGLTPREHDIARAALDGLSRATAAERLDMNEGTHRSHVTRLLRKTGHPRLSALVASLSAEESSEALP